MKKKVVDQKIAGGNYETARIYYQDKTYVHGMVKNICIGILSASATWVCPKNAHSVFSNKIQQEMYQTMINAYLIR